MIAITTVDYLFIAILLVTLVHGFTRGFTRGFCMAIALLISLAVAMLVGNLVGNHFASPGEGVSGSEVVGNYKPIIAFLVAGLFACGFLLGLFIVGKLTGPRGMLGFGDQCLGGIMGLANGSIIILAIMSCAQFTSYAADTNYQGSLLVGKLTPIVAKISELSARNGAQDMQ